MLPRKQAIDKPIGQNLSGEGGESAPLSFTVTRTQVWNNGLSIEMKEKSDE